MRTNHLVALFAIASSVFASEADAHKARVYNDTSLELEIKVFHFERPDKWWTIETLDPGEKSRIANLAHGTRVLVAKDAINDNVVLTYDFVAADFGQRFRLVEQPSGEITVGYATVPVNEEP